MKLALAYFKISVGEKMTTYLDIDELAVILGKSARTIKRNLAKNASVVPPKMHFADSQMLRWRVAEVEQWIVETGWPVGKARR